MNAAVVDIETDGLLETCTKIHCLVLRCVESGEVETYSTLPGYPSIAQGVERLKGISKLIGHNLIAFDRPAIRKLTGYEIPWEAVYDTQVVAAMRWTDLKERDLKLIQAGKLSAEFRGKNHLKSWGYRLGIFKGTYGESSDWSTCTEEMVDYCRQDTAVTLKLYEHIQKAGVSDLAVETEQELRLYLQYQEAGGWPFNIEKAIELNSKLVARREEIAEELRGVFGWWYRKGKEFTPARDNKKMGYVAGCPLTKIEKVVFNPGSRQHISNRLQVLYGWKPTKFTEKGQPQIDETVIEELPPGIPGVNLLGEYLMLVKRIGQISEGKNAWLQLATKERVSGGKITGLLHVHHACLQSGTVTHRASHIRPNLAQVPAVGIAFGYECRDLFYVPDGWVQVGSDASGLELRDLAHYMARWDNGVYAKVVSEGKNEDGTDVHTLNAKALDVTRKAAKTWIYAHNYGAGDLKLGLSAPPSSDEIAKYKTTKKWKQAKDQLANRQQPTDDYSVACFIHGGVLRSRMMKATPALKNLIEAVKVKAKEQGYLTLPDGRRVPVRHQHAALNSLLQGAGAVICKMWTVRAFRRLVAEFGEPGWKDLWSPLGFVHDELQIACRPHIAERVCEILVEEIRKVGIELNLKCPLDGEAKVGHSWAETH